MTCASPPFARKNLLPSDVRGRDPNSDERLCWELPVFCLRIDCCCKMLALCEGNELALHQNINTAVVVHIVCHPTLFVVMSSACTKMPFSRGSNVTSTRHDNYTSCHTLKNAYIPKDMGIAMNRNSKLQCSQYQSGKTGNQFGQHTTLKMQEMSVIEISNTAGW